MVQGGMPLQCVWEKVFKKMPDGEAGERGPMSDVIQTFVPENLREIADGLALLRLPPNLRRRLLARMGRMTIAQARKNVREQKTVDGSAMEPRKRKPPKTRKVYHKDGRITSKKTHAEMLHDIVRSKWLGVKADEDRATVFFFRNAGYVGYKHQTGASEAFERIKAEDADHRFRRDRGTAVRPS